MACYLEVAVSLPLPQTFTYFCPDELTDFVKMGTKVLVPFAKSKMTGCVVEIKTESSYPKTKSILDILDPELMLDKHLLDLTKWLSQYYLCSWGEAIFNALPAGLDQSIDKYVTFHPTGNYELFELPFDPNYPKTSLLKIIKDHKRINIKKLKQLYHGRKTFYHYLNQLILKGEVILDEEETAPSVKIRYNKTIQLIQPEENALENLEKLTKKQAGCLELLIAADAPVLVKELNARGYSNHVLNNLVSKKIAAYGKIESYRDPVSDEKTAESGLFHLTDDQQKIINQVQEKLDQQKYHTFLLHGITGSGKTRVYIELCKKVIATGKQALMLVPEIALTPQMIYFFHTHFSNRIGLWHSRLSVGERYDTWRRCIRGEYDVMIGTRSAIFSPLANLGLIIVDEEHEHTYKQDTVPRYNGRDVAVMRAKMLNIVCLLGSATPSLESHYNAMNRRYDLLELPVRIAQRALPTVAIIDMRKEPHHLRISKTLAEKIEERLTRQEGIILFLNRRGFSTYVFCCECGYTYTCEHCHVTLTYHSATHQLKCHYCDYTRKPPLICDGCGSAHLSYRGSGTQRIEDEIQRQFKTARILRMDVDSTSRKGSHKKILEEFRQGLANILVGTQMVAKGLDFPHVTLVGVISADVSLNFPDFRAAERTFQLLTQVAGRAGRGNKPGEVVIQTYSPNHYAVMAAKNHDYPYFSQQEIKNREELAYPPFTRLIGIIVSGKNEKDVIRVIQELRLILNSLQLPGISDVLGPAPAPISKIKDMYRWLIIIKSDNNNELRCMVYEQINALQAKYASILKITINVDPYGL